MATAILLYSRLKTNFVRPNIGCAMGGTLRNLIERYTFCSIQITRDILLGVVNTRKYLQRQHRRTFSNFNDNINALAELNKISARM
jgi:hypothetical protein